MRVQPPLTKYCSTQISDKWCEKLMTIPICSMNFSPAPGVTVEGIMAHYHSVSQAGRMAIHLALHFFFGPDVMYFSTVKGAGSKSALDPQKLKQIELLILQKFGRRLSQVDRIALWSWCRTAIGQKCKSLRK